MSKNNDVIKRLMEFLGGWVPFRTLRIMSCIKAWSTEQHQWHLNLLYGAVINEPSKPLEFHRQVWLRVELGLAQKTRPPRCRTLELRSIRQLV